MDQLISEVYQEDIDEKEKEDLTKEISKLQDLNLINQSKKGKYWFLTITPTGKRVVEEQIIKKIVIS